MSADENINKLPKLLKELLGSTKKIVHTDITRLTAPGENFGSIMLRVDLTLVTEEGVEEKIHAVAKKLPATELFREIFNIQVTFKNEVAFYHTVLPTIRDFEKENNIKDVLQCFATPYGARISLNEDSDIVDNDAVLVLENLLVSGFENIDRLQGFNLDEAKFLLRDVAKFHGTTLALKLNKPDVFKQKVKIYCHDYTPKPDISDLCLAATKDILLENPACHNLISKVSMWGQRPRPTPREPFATLAHCDLWVNNTLQKFQNGKMVGNKLVDFQVFAYRSAVSDLFFFLWSSVQLNVLENHLDHLLEFYHKILIETLTEFKCNTKPFSYECFLEELRLESTYEFGHAIQFATYVVQGKKGGSEITEFPCKEYFLKNLTPAAKAKVFFMVLECERRGWLN